MKIQLINKIETGLDEETFKFLIEDYSFLHGKEALMADFEVIYCSGEIFIPNNSEIEFLLDLDNSFKYELDELESSLRKDFNKNKTFVLNETQIKLNQLS